MEVDLQGMFGVIKNDKRKRWEFEPKKGVEQNSYTVAFYECDNLSDAWIAIYKAITERDKRRLSSNI